MVIFTSTMSIIFQSVKIQLLLLIAAVTIFLLNSPSKHKCRRLYHRLSRLVSIILTVILFQVVFRSEGEILWSYGIVQITTVGISYGIITALRLLLIVIIAGVLFDVPYYEYLLAFKQWRIPYEISFLVATVIHLLPIFNTHFEQRREALLLRGIELRKLPLAKRPAAYLTLLFPIVANTINEVRSRAISLELRAFRISPHRSSLYSSKLYPKDYITFSFYITILIFMIYLIK